ERAIDMFASEIGMDTAEERRINLARAFPHDAGSRANDDPGAYAAALETETETAGYAELRAQQAARRAEGGPLQLGIGICSYVEWTGFGSELGTCEVEDDGKVTVRSGASAHGQGHETAFAQLVSGTLGVPF